MNKAMATMEITKAKTALKKYFGYDEFRPMQAEIIQAVYDKKDVLVLMPTGGGKSICFQIPAITKQGVCIVVSPLISLMKDQVESLRANGIKASFLNSSLTTKEQHAVEDELYHGTIDLLYVSPEKLLSQSFLPLIKQANVNLFAIDEAHCISSWGHDFRPEYTQMKFLKKQFPTVPIIALTATADKITRRDIVKQLQFNHPEIFIASFDRPNLSLDVRPGQKKKEQLLSFLKKRSDHPGIVYCLSKKNTEQVASILVNAGYKADFYHAGMSGANRSRIQEDFINDKLQIVCATVAFGMGIDKSNVRWVVHYNLPKNIESFYQEIGRAGRDGTNADTLLFYSFRDVTVLRSFFDDDDSAMAKIKLAKLDRMMEYADSLICRRKILLNYFGENLEKNCGNCDVCKNPPSSFDGTVIVQKALSAIARLQERVGMNILIDVLRGSRRREILERGYDKIKTYGMGADISAFDWQFLVRQMLNLGLIEIAYDQHNVLKLTASAKAVLFDGKRIQLVKMAEIKEKMEAKKVQINAQIKPASQRQRTRNELFEILRALRLKIARKKSIPPYIVFSDKTLEEIAAERPTNEMEFMEISGVGEKKLQLYGQAFIKEVLSFIENDTSGLSSKLKPSDNLNAKNKSSNIDKEEKIKISTQLQTFQLYKRGFSVNEIAIKRDLSLETIYTHLITLYEKGSAVDIKHFVSKPEMSKIIEAFQHLPEPHKLKDIYEYLNKKVDYHKIQFAQSFYLKHVN